MTAGAPAVVRLVGGAAHFYPGNIDPQAGVRHRRRMDARRSVTAFHQGRRLASGEPDAVAQAIAAEGAADGTVVILDDATGHVVEIDRRPPARQGAAAPTPSAARPGRGRPKMGVVAREVTLLPRHWDWLARQPGGASAALRRLVEAGLREAAGPDRARAAQESLYRVMSALAGDAPGFEAASRALFARDDAAFDALLAAWPPDVAAYVAGFVAAERGARASSPGSVSPTT